MDQDYIDIEAHIRHAQKLRSEAMGELIFSSLERGKNSLVFIDLVGGILVLLLVAASVLVLMHSPLASIAGIVSAVLAVLWLWLAWESVSNGPSPAP